MKSIWILLAIALLSSCGEEHRETRLFGPDAVKIAGDTPPWSNQPFNGDQQAWTEQAEKRARLMNEYTRIH